MAGSVDPSVEFLREGRRQLGESLAVVAQHGEAGVADYMTELLGDTEGKAPAGERAAAFDMLGRAQKTRNGEKLAAEGGKTLASLDSIDQETKKHIGGAMGPQRMLESNVQNAHAGVVKRVRGGDSRGGVQAHEEVSGLLGRFGQ